MELWADAVALTARNGMSGITTDQADAALEAASDLLDGLTGRQYGLRTATVRPQGCGQGCDPGAPSGRAVVGWGLSQPLARMVGPWPLPGPAGGMADLCSSCGTRWAEAVDLCGPVTEVVEVRVDGAALSSADFQVWDDHLLIRSDGARWPSCQNLRLDPATDVHTFQVTYSHGVPVPALGVQAALSLAAELAKWWGWASGDCQLPKRVTSIVSQGMSMAVVDPMTPIQEGFTGLTDVDLFVVSATKPRRRATIATPGYEPELRRRTL